MIEVRTTEVFDKWLGRLTDRKAKARIQARIDRVGRIQLPRQSIC